MPLFCFLFFKNMDFINIFLVIVRNVWVIIYLKISVLFGPLTEFN